MSLDCQHIDLHCHSTASDGRLTPTELVERMAEAGVKLLALTDHDSTNGIAEARQAAEVHGIQLLNGVEISARLAKQTVHIVGLGIDIEQEDLVAGLSNVQAIREERAGAIATKLEAAGVSDALQRATELADGGQVTRTHFARLLVDDGKVKDMKRAFKQYLAAGKSAYVSAEWPDMQEAIRWIHAAGGLAVLAHPMRYGLTGNKRRQMLRAFKNAGGDALEVNCGPNCAAENQVAADDVRRLELMASVGSDFHDPKQGWIKLGQLPPLADDLPPVWQAPSFVAATTEERQR